MKQFKAESKKILDLMINSIYTNKEVFLRELISNASDAIDKLYFKSLQENLGLNFDSFSIHLDHDSKKKTITITDNGIGMNKEELEQYLGVIAKSDSESFKEANKEKEDVNIIGRFGVGFYSSFMIAKKVIVLSKKYGEDMAYEWSSNGIEGYNTKETNKDSHGTTIILTLKDDKEEENYSKYCSEYELKDLVKKYSNYVRYPIIMSVEKKELDSDGKETKNTYSVDETINSMTPIWNKKKNELSEEEINSYYDDEFHDSEKPISSIFISLEGSVDYKAVLFIPRKAPYDYYYKSFEKGLKLYSSNVLIMDKCKDLLPDHYSMVRGVVSSDLNLNISREVIQQTSELSKIAKSIEKKIKAELLNLLKEKREDYEVFFDSFGRRIKYSIWESYGMLSEELKDLLIFKSVKTDKYVSLEEYVKSMKEEDKYIYFARSNSIASAKLIPQVDYLLKKEVDILLFNYEVDEFLTKIMSKYMDKEFKSVTSGAINEEKIEYNDEEKQVLDYIKEKLGSNIEAANFSNTIGDFPVTFTSSGPISVEMEKTINQGPKEEAVSANKNLEINKEHKIHDILLSLNKEDKSKLDEVIDVLYNLARLNAGLEVDNIQEVIKKIANLI
jgi:molecular chaperone HtpG